MMSLFGSHAAKTAVVLFFFCIAASAAAALAVALFVERAPALKARARTHVYYESQVVLLLFGLTTEKVHCRHWRRARCVDAGRR